MSQTTRARVPAPAQIEPARRSIFSAALLVAGWTFIVGLTFVGVVVLIGWATTAHQDTSAAQAFRAAAQLWLACQHVPVALSSGSISFLPLGLVALPGVLGLRTGRWAAIATGVDQLPRAALLTAGAAVTYGTLAAGLAGVSHTHVGAAAPAQAFLGATGIGLVSIGLGVLRGGGLWPELIALVPPGARPLLREIAMALAMLMCVAAGLLAISIASNAGSIMTAMRTLGAAGPSGLLLVLLGLVYLPNALLWSLAYVCGPGFAVGTGTLISPLGHTGGALPNFPLFLAVPEHAGTMAHFLLLVPVAAGLLIAWRRRSRGPFDRIAMQAFADSLAVAAGCGIITAVVTMLAAGALGGGHLAQLGPDGVAVGAACAGLVLVGVWLGSTASAVEQHFARRGDA